MRRPQQRKHAYLLTPPSVERNALLVLIEQNARDRDVRSYFLGAGLTVWEVDAVLEHEGISFPGKAPPPPSDGISPERRGELQELSLTE